MPIESKLALRVSKTCPSCLGTGLQITNEWRNASNYLEVMVRVCPCVKVVHIVKKEKPRAD